MSSSWGGGHDDDPGRHRLDLDRLLDRVQYPAAAVCSIVGLVFVEVGAGALGGRAAQEIAAGGAALLAAVVLAVTRR